MINLDPTLDQQLLDIAIREAVPRKYQRTARMITSGGYRNPLNAEAGTGEETRERAIVIA